MSRKIYSLEKVEELSDNDQDFIKSIVHVFIEEVPDDLAQLKEAVDQRDRKGTHAFAHKLKPSVDLFGIECLKELKKLEEWGKGIYNGDEIALFFDKVELDLNEAIVQLKNDF